ncbi:MAG TPA: hypothetical protein DDY17_08780 [Syntrophaceae bacterium]|jgi:gas vesicle protein|nr:hypothetical protein [Syntrophaceae bacterium]
MTANDYVEGLIVGSLIGAEVGILYAPKRSNQTSEDIQNSSEELLQKAKNSMRRHAKNCECNGPSEGIKC